MRSTASNPAKWFLDWLGGEQSQAGIAVDCDNAQRSATVYACVNVRAQDMAKLPLILYRRVSDDERERATKHPLYSLLADTPNTFQTSFEWRELLSRHLDLRGNAYSRIYRDGRFTPRKLVPLHPDWVRVLRAPSGDIIYEVRMYGSGRVERLSSEDVLHIKGPSDDGYCGKSIISAARDVIGLALASQRHASKVFANGGRPGGIVSLKGQTSEEARDHHEEKWQKKFTGENAMRVAVFAEGTTYTPIGMTNEDAQFTDLMKQSNSDIAKMFRVPPHKVGIMDNATFSNIEHQALEYVTDTLHPLARRWEQALNATLLRESEKGDYYFEFNFDALLRGDLKSRMEAYMTARQNGFINGNFVTRRESWPKIPAEKGGDDYWIPSNMLIGGEPRPEKAAAATSADPPPAKKSLNGNGVEGHA